MILDIRDWALGIREDFTPREAQILPLPLP